MALGGRHDIDDRADQAYDDAVVRYMDDEIEAHIENEERMNGLPQNGDDGGKRRDENVYADHLAAIDAAATKEELMKAFGAAWKAMRKFGERMHGLPQNVEDAEAEGEAAFAIDAAKSVALQLLLQSVGPQHREQIKLIWLLGYYSGRVAGINLVQRRLPELETELAKAFWMKKLQEGNL